MEKNEEEFNRAVDRIADIIIEGARDSYKNDLQPFEGYAEKMRKEIHDNMIGFKDRFVRGYEILTAELKKKKGDR